MKKKGIYVKVLERINVMSKLEQVLTILLIITFLIYSGLLANSNETTTELENQVSKLNSQIEENETVIQKLKKPDVTKSITIPAAEAQFETIYDGKDITLGFGTFVVGEDIEPGTYTLTPVSGYGNMFVKGILGGTTFSHTFGYNQFDEESLRPVKNVTLNDSETIEINDVEVKFEAKESKEETMSATEESVESMTRTYDNLGAVWYECTKEDETIDCQELVNYDKLKKQVDKE